MRGLTSLLLLFILSITNAQQNYSFKISGTIKNLNGKTIQLFRSTYDEFKIGQLIKEVQPSANGTFDFQVNATEESEYIFIWQRTDTINKKSIPSDKNLTEKLTFINDTSNILIEGDVKDLNSFIIKGAKISESIDQLDTIISNQEQSFCKIQASLDSAKQVYKQNLNITKNKTRDVLFQYYNQNKSLIAKFILLKKLRNLYCCTEEDRDSLTRKLYKDYPNHTLIKELTQGTYVKSINLDKKDKPKPEMFLDDGNHGTSWITSSGQDVNLHSFKGRYILFDFWASWCDSCHQQAKFLSKLLTQYQEKKFIIISITCDRDFNSWINAIAKDKRSWINLAYIGRIGVWGEYHDDHMPYIEDYNSSNITIPYSILVDPQGYAILKSPTNEILEQKLKEIFK